MSIESIYRQALSLSDADRIELATRLFSSADSTEQQAIHNAWMDEIDRRRSQFLRGELQTIAYEEVMRIAIKE